MRARFSTLLAVAAILLLPSISRAQQVGPPYFPQTLPANTVVGRTSAGVGPASAIPFTTLAPLLGISQTISINGTPVAGGTSGQCLSILNGFVSSQTCSGGGGGGSPGGSNTQLQFNNTGSFGGVSGATSNGTAVNFSNNDLIIGSTVLASAGGGTITFPAATGTVALTSAANVASVSNSDGSLTISPTTGSVVASLALGHANTWTAAQTFNNGDFKLAGSSSGTTTLAPAATASGTISFPAVTDTVAVLGTADQVVTGGANVTTQSLTTGNVTVDCGSRPLQKITNGGAFTITAPANDGSCIVLVTNNASASTVSFSGFSVGSNTGDSLDSTNTHKFSIFIWEINGVAGYRIAAHQ